MDSVAVAGRTDTRVAGPLATVRPWSETEFAGAAGPWNALLERSAANPLFMSWEWQSLWWRQHQAVHSAQLLILAGYDAAGELIGLAPLYLHRASHRGLFSLRVESIGTCWRGQNEVFSEYLDFIVQRGSESEFLAAVAAYLHDDGRWSDLVLGNTRTDGLAARLVREHFDDSMYVRTVDPLTAHIAALPRDFADYVRSLDSSTRRRVWNHRKKLNGARLCAVGVDRVLGALDQVDSFHLQRWGQPHYVGVRRAFHQQFAAAMARRQALRMSELRNDDRVISIMYNVRIRDTEYNVQSGFGSVAGISPGYLHFGYCIEEACAQGVRSFDFLGGAGLHREYKSDFRTVQAPMATLQCIRSRPLAWIYREYDRRFPHAVGAAAIAVPLLHFAEL